MREARVRQLVLPGADSDPLCADLEMIALVDAEEACTLEPRDGGE